MLYVLCSGDGVCAIGPVTNPCHYYRWQSFYCWSTRLVRKLDFVSDRVTIYSHWERSDRFGLWSCASCRLWMCGPCVADMRRRNGVYFLCSLPLWRLVWTHLGSSTLDLWHFWMVERGLSSEVHSLNWALSFNFKLRSQRTEIWPCSLFSSEIIISVG